MTGQPIPCLKSGVSHALFKSTRRVPDLYANNQLRQQCMKGNEKENLEVQ
jgi:hypothetical protein